jgi:hypothetical protein
MSNRAPATNMKGKEGKDTQTGLSLLPYKNIPATGLGPRNIVAKPPITAATTTKPTIIRRTRSSNGNVNGVAATPHSNGSSSTTSAAAGKGSASSQQTKNDENSSFTRTRSGRLVYHLFVSASCFIQ